MHTNVILTNKKAHTHNLTNTKLKASFRHLLRHPARKRSGPILHPRTHTGDNTISIVVTITITINRFNKPGSKKTIVLRQASSVSSI